MCYAYYCQLDAKMDAEIAALRPALASGYVELMTRARCLRILTSEDGTKATGVLIERDGEQRLLHADVVALCAGVGRSAHLLSYCEPRNIRTGSATPASVSVFIMADTPQVCYFPCSASQRSCRNAHQDLRNKRLLQWCTRLALSVGCIQAVGQIPFWDRDVVAWWKRYAARLVGERSVFCLYMTEALPTKESGFQVSEGRIVGMRPPVQNTATFEKLRLLWLIDIFRRAGYQVVAPRHRALYHPTGTLAIGAPTFILSS